MSRGYGKKKRRSVVRPGAGGAILRFLIGVVLLIGLCGAFYLFVLQGTVPLSPIVPGTSSPAEPTGATNAPTSVPTIEPTAAATATPTPEPTATPVPQEVLAGAVALPAALPAQPDPQVKLGLKELNLFDAAGQSVIIVRGFAFLEGLDAAASRGYILLTDPTSGETLGVYPISPYAEDADLSFDETAGAHLDQAFFRMNIDVSGLPDGYYLVCIAVENGGRIAWNYVDNSMYHFRIDHGAAMLNE